MNENFSFISNAVADINVICQFIIYCYQEIHNKMEIV